MYRAVSHIKNVIQGTGNDPLSIMGTSSISSTSMNKKPKRASVILKFTIEAGQRSAIIETPGIPGVARGYRILKTVIHPGIIKLKIPNFNLRIADFFRNRNTVLPVDTPLSLPEILQGITETYNRVALTSAFHFGPDSYMQSHYDLTTGVFGVYTAMHPSRRFSAGSAGFGPWSALGIDFRSEGSSPVAYPLLNSIRTKTEFASKIPCVFDVFCPTIQSKHYISDTCPFLSLIRDPFKPVEVRTTSKSFYPLSPVMMNAGFEFSVKPEVEFPSRDIGNFGSSFNNEFITPQIDITIEFQIDVV